MKMSPSYRLRHQFEGNVACLGLSASEFSPLVSVTQATVILPEQGTFISPEK